MMCPLVLLHSRKGWPIRGSIADSNRDVRLRPLLKMPEITPVTHTLIHKESLVIAEVPGHG